MTAGGGRRTWRMGQTSLGGRISALRRPTSHALFGLIRHENDQVQRVEMRGGEGVGLPGYDGTV